MFLSFNISIRYNKTNCPFTYNLTYKLFEMPMKETSSPFLNIPETFGSKTPR